MDTHSGISTAPLVIRKVDKGKIVSDDGGPVSQMQKIALQRINQDGTRHYLSAAGPMPGTAGAMSPAPGQAGSHPLIFQSPRVREDVKDGVRTVTDEVDDYLCWTIVGICELCAFTRPSSCLT
jgi:recombining binding protein (suppressor of hairless)